MTTDGGSSSTAASGNSALSNATPEQMKEMMAMLQTMQTSESSASGGESSRPPSGATANAYSLPLHRLPPLPSACHPVRRFVTANRRLSTILACAVGFFMAYSLAHSHSGSRTDAYGAPVALSSGETKKGLMSDFVIKSPFAKQDDLLYYNVPGKTGADSTEQSALPRSSYPDGGAAVCFLVTSSHKDVSDIQTALHSLAFLQGDQNRNLPPSPILVFNEGDLSQEQILAMVSSTNRPIAFPKVDFSKFPDGFNPDDFDKGPQFKVAERKPWGYYQMIRFWVSGIWYHPAVERFETIMRMDSDSCFKKPNEYLPHMAHDHIVYHSQFVGVESEAGKEYLNGLFDFTKEYLARINRFPGNAMLWNFIETTWGSKGTLPLFRTNLEISSKAFMTRSDVDAWHRALTEEEPFGMFRFRWGDAVTRFIEAAVFATDETTLTMKAEGYEHKNGCSWVEVEKALQENGLL
uniref:Nucleotide-diphospho-sugar transferase domain-containing protein n=1 Tax=Odontella aurita TaxID=265563 RepID=A0A7S4INL7_9STRA